MMQLAASTLAFAPQAPDVGQARESRIGEGAKPSGRRVVSNDMPWSSRLPRNFGSLLVGAVCWLELCGCAHHPSLISQSATRPPAALRSAPAASLPNVEGAHNVSTKPSCRPRDSFPSRQGFLDEVLFSEPTARTPRFDDYTPDSYHIEKQDLVAGLIQQSDACSLKLRAILIVGPLGMLWAYRVATFVDEGNQLRVNIVTIPHARITEKRTASISVEAALRILDDISKSPRVFAGRQSPADSDPEGAGEFASNLLLVKLDGAQPSYWHAKLRDIFPASDDKEVLGLVNRLVDMTTTTYRHGDPILTPEGAP
jgi:hypothetical protein